ncbi:MAG: acyl carrier protein [Polaromonas sp.]|nr:acyl carrier protein [Polaromonas sp.]
MLDQEKLKNVIATVLNVDSSRIDANASSDTIESWDSLRHMNLVLALEEEFGVSLPDEEAANATSYPLLVLVLQDLLQKS